MLKGLFHELKLVHHIKYICDLKHKVSVFDVADVPAALVVSVLM